MRNFLRKNESENGDQKSYEWNLRTSRNLIFSESRKRERKLLSPELRKEIAVERLTISYFFSPNS